MATETEVKSDLNGSKSGDENTENEIDVNRSAEEYAKRVVELSAENKKRKEREKTLQAKLDEAQAKLNNADEEKAKEQGKYKESYEKTKTELAVEKSARQKEKASYAFKIVTGQLAQAAAKVGCIDTEALVKLSGSYGLLDDLEPDDEFNLTEDNVKSVIEQAQSKMPFLFGKAAPKVVDGTSKVVKTDGKKDLSQVSLQDKIRALTAIDQERFQKATENGDRRTFKTGIEN